MFRCVVVPALHLRLDSGFLAGVEIQLVSRRMSVVMVGSLHRLMEKVEKPLGAGTQLDSGRWQVAALRLKASKRLLPAWTWVRSLKRSHGCSRRPVKICTSPDCVGIFDDENVTNEEICKKTCKVRPIRAQGQ